MRLIRQRYFARLLWLIFVLAASLPAFSQKQSAPLISFPTSVETYKLNSKLMAREMSYRIVLPFEYKKNSGKHPVIYLLHGLDGHFDNLTEKTKVAQYNRDFIIVTPEGGDGWYTDSGSENNDRYESYITEELIPEIDKKFRTVADRNHRFIAGISMGGYGAIKFGLKRPDLFALVGSFSGVLDAAISTEKELGKNVAESIRKVFGAFGSQTRMENDPFLIIRNLPAEKIKDLPFIYSTCGTEDKYFKSNIDFAGLLREKKIPHEFRELPGTHSWTFWDSQLQEFLRLSQRFLK